MNNDDLIIQRCRSGLSAGFASLLAAYQDSVYRRAYSFVQHRDDALDITQEVFLRVVRSIQSVEPGRPLWPWLRRITTNLSLTLLRRRHPVESLDTPRGVAIPADTPDPSDSAELAWDVQQLHLSLSRLPPLWRMVVVLRHQEDLSYEEIARVTDLPLGTVKTYLFRARRVLRDDLLAERGSV